MAFDLTYSVAMRNVVLFVHILAAIALLGPVFLIPLISATFKGKPPNPVITIMSMIERQAMQFVPFQLITGFWLVGMQKGDKWSMWLIISIVLFVGVGLVAFFVNRPKMNAALQAMHGGNDLKAIELLRIPTKVTGPILALTTMVILFLMVAKPGA